MFSAPMVCYMSNHGSQGLPAGAKITEIHRDYLWIPAPESREDKQINKECPRRFSGTSGTSGPDFCVYPRNTRGTFPRVYGTVATLRFRWEVGAKHISSHVAQLLLNFWATFVKHSSIFLGTPLKALLATTLKLTHVLSRAAKGSWAWPSIAPLRMMTDNLQRWEPKSGDTILTLYLREVESCTGASEILAVHCARSCPCQEAPARFCPRFKTSETAGRNAFARLCPPHGF